MATSQEEINEIFNKIEAEFKNIDHKLGNFMVNKISEEINAKVPIRTGALKQSIQVKWDSDNTKVLLGMRVYGYFVNFGVLGYSGQGNADVVDTSLWGVVPSQGDKFKFKRTPKIGISKAKELGISPEPFLPTKEEIDQMIELFIKEYQSI